MNDREINLNNVSNLNNIFSMCILLSTIEFYIWSLSFYGTDNFRIHVFTQIKTAALIEG